MGCRHHDLIVIFGAWHVRRRCTGRAVRGNDTRTIPPTATERPLARSNCQLPKWSWCRSLYIQWSLCRCPHTHTILQTCQTLDSVACPRLVVVAPPRQYRYLGSMLKLRSVMRCLVAGTRMSCGLLGSCDMCVAVSCLRVPLGSLCSSANVTLSRTLQPDIFYEIRVLCG